MRGDLEIALTAAGNLHVSIGIALADEMPTEKASKKFQAGWVHLKLRVNIRILVQPHTKKILDIKTAISLIGGNFQIFLSCCHTSKIRWVSLVTPY